MNNENKPLIAVTMGDPSGVGPEIVALALNADDLYEKARPVVIGSIPILTQAVELYDLDLDINEFKEDQQNDFGPGKINVIDSNFIEPEAVNIGDVQKQSGRASYLYIKRATELILEAKLDAMATAPIHKEALKLVGIPEAGCTEILGKLTETTEPLTMFEIDDLRIFFHSRHVSLMNAIQLVRKDKVVQMIQRSIHALESIGIEHNNFAVAGLNPHCSDGGLFGSEEAEELIPAVALLNKKGYNVIGPIGADSVFHLTKENNWDGVLSLYHDQGHIAAKTLDFYKTVSITLDLPFIRTSVDHGTALDIAGKGQANPTSMIEAILVAAKYAPKYKSN